MEYLVNRYGKKHFIVDYFLVTIKILDAGVLCRKFIINVIKTIKEKDISQYQLIKNHGFSTCQLDRLRKNQNVNSYTLNTLCEILECNLSDIAEYVKE